MSKLFLPEHHWSPREGKSPHAAVPSKREVWVQALLIFTLIMGLQRFNNEWQAMQTLQQAAGRRFLEFCHVQNSLAMRMRSRERNTHCPLYQVPEVSHSFSVITPQKISKL